MKEIMSSVICLDASFLIRTLTPNPQLKQATSLLEKWIENHAALIAPSLLTYEVSSVLRRLQYHKKLDSALAQETFTTFQQLGVAQIDTPQVHNLAWRLAQQFHHARTYVATYLAIAQLHNAELWTADKKLHASVSDQFEWVHCI